MFKELFEKYGYKVEKFEDSFIADNGVFCVLYTEKDFFGIPEIAAVSFLSYDKDILKKHYKGKEKIGHCVFEDWMMNRLPCMHTGSICNHDHSITELEWALKNMLK